ncbi:MAG: outer membrane protein assembly factor BamE [Gammaproteobacteria bacterium]|nr:outer membrane protein assembly factor BamE [Gammaproteobacteria bacterium]
MKKKAITFVFSLPILIGLIGISGCSVYRVDIQQGNEITVAMVEKLEMGMSQRAVTRVLGFPLINDPFHKDRWDYFYYKREGSTGKTTQKLATLIFKDGKLIEVKGDVAE